MSKQHRYETEQEILEEIERCKRLGEHHLAAAVALEKDIDDAKRKIPVLESSRRAKEREEARYLVSQLPGWRLQVKKHNKTASRYLDGRMFALKNTLAAFRTELLRMENNADMAVVEHKGRARSNLLINARRESPPLMFAKLVSLIVLVVVLVVDMRYRVKHRAFRERFDYCISNANYATSVQNFRAADMWLKQSEIETVKFYGASYTNL